MLRFEEFLKKCETIGTYQYKESKFRSLQERASQYNSIMKHIKDDKFIIIISVEKDASFFNSIGIDNADEYAEGKNEENTRSFRAQLKTAKISYTNVNGGYKESYIDKNGFKHHVDFNEHSTICYGNSQNANQLIELCVKWTKKTYQNSILFATNGEALLYFTNECDYKPDSNSPTIHKAADSTEYIGDFHPTKLGDYFTTIREINSSDKFKTQSVEHTFEFTKDERASKDIRRYFDGKQISEKYDHHYYS